MGKGGGLHSMMWRRKILLLIYYTSVKSRVVKVKFIFMDLSAFDKLNYMLCCGRIISIPKTCRLTLEFSRKGSNLYFEPT